MADALLFGDVAREFFDVPFGLIDLRHLRLDAVQISAIGEIDDGDDGRHRKESVEADRADQLSDETCGRCTRKICERGVEEVALPNGPETLARAQGQAARD